VTRGDRDRAAAAAALVSLRPLLFSIAYRMLGSVSEAEDVLQEAFLRYQGALAVAVDDLHATGAKALGVPPGDMTRPTDVACLVAAAGDALGGVDILVNNVGGGRGGGLEQTTDEDLAWTLDVNSMAAVRASRLVVPLMRRRGGDRIITISSIWGREAGGKVAFNAAKAAERGERAVPFASVVLTSGAAKLTTDPAAPRWPSTAPTTAAGTSRSASTAWSTTS